MRIESQNINFQSRSLSVRNAEGICRIVNNNFASFSPFKFLQIGKRHKSLSVYKKVLQKQQDLIYGVRQSLNVNGLLKNSAPFYKKLVEKVKEKRLANCSELTHLCKMICDINGINSTIVEMSLVKKHEQTYISQVDHMALAIPVNGKKFKSGILTKSKDILIIDPLLGFADYAPKVEERYEKDFKSFIELADGQEIGIMSTYEDNCMPTTEKDKLREMFPEFVLKDSWKIK